MVKAKRSNEPRPMGRPKSANPKDEVLYIKCTADLKSLVQRAASAMEISDTDYCRLTLRQAAKKDLVRLGVADEDG